MRFLLIFWGLWATTTWAQEGAPPAMPVDVIVAQEQNMATYREFSGNFEAADTVKVTPQISGKIEAIHFQDNALIQKGQLLFTIERAPYRAALTRSEGAVLAAKGQLTNATATYKRAQQLLKERVVSKQRVDDALSALNIAKGLLQAAEADVERNKIDYERTEVKAPIAGRIGRAEVTLGNVVETGFGNPPVLATIVQLSPLYASFTMDEETYLKTLHPLNEMERAALPVELGLGSSGDTPLKGRFHSVDNLVNQENGTIRVRVVYDNPDGKVIPGLFARIRLGAKSDGARIFIPDAAVGTDQSKKFVLIVNAQNMTEYREVALGGVSNGLRMIASGLKAGEKVLVSNLVFMQPGTPVIPKVVNVKALR
jgi:membrane fusion protein, multidrug efflux system